MKTVQITDETHQLGQQHIKRLNACEQANPTRLKGFVDMAVRNEISGGLQGRMALQSNLAKAFCAEMSEPVQSVSHNLVTMIGVKPYYRLIVGFDCKRQIVGVGDTPERAYANFVSRYFEADKGDDK